MVIVICMLIYCIVAFSAGDVSGTLVAGLPLFIGAAAGVYISISDERRRKDGAKCYKNWIEYKKKNGIK